MHNVKIKQAALQKSWSRQHQIHASIRRVVRDGWKWEKAVKQKKKSLAQPLRLIYHLITGTTASPGFHFLYSPKWSHSPLIYGQITIRLQFRCCLTSGSACVHSHWLCREKPILELSSYAQIAQKRDHSAHIKYSVVTTTMVRTQMFFAAFFSIKHWKARINYLVFRRSMLWIGSQSCSLPGLPCAK